MPGSEATRLQRSYERNLSWCRFWLGISLAVATLTFTFAMDQVFYPWLEPTAPAEQALDRQADGKTPTMPQAGDVEPPDSFSPIGALVSALLFCLSFSCAALSWWFRVLYHADDADLAQTAEDLADTAKEKEAAP